MKSTEYPLSLTISTKSRSYNPRLLNLSIWQNRRESWPAKSSLASFLKEVEPLLNPYSPSRSVARTRLTGLIRKRQPRPCHQSKRKTLAWPKLGSTVNLTIITMLWSKKKKKICPQPSLLSTRLKIRFGSESILVSSATLNMVDCRCRVIQ